MHLNEVNTALKQFLLKLRVVKIWAGLEEFSFPFFTESGLSPSSQVNLAYCYCLSPTSSQMAQGCAEDFSKVNKRIKDASNYILTQCTYILRLSPLRKQLLALPYLFSPDKLLTSLLCLYNRHIRRPWSSSGRISSADPRLACGGWSRGPWKEECWRIPGTWTHWGHTRRRRDTKSRGTAPPRTRWVVSLICQVFEKRHKTYREMVDNESETFLRQTANDHRSSLTDAGVVNCGAATFPPVTAVSNLLPSALRQPPRSRPTSGTVIFMGLVASVVTPLPAGFDLSLKPFDWCEIYWSEQQQQFCPGNVYVLSLQGDGINPTLLSGGRFLVLQVCFYSNAFVFCFVFSFYYYYY